MYLYIVYDDLLYKKFCKFFNYQQKLKSNIIIRIIIFFHIIMNDLFIEDLKKWTARPIETIIFN
jgi:hypothetical protein